MAVSDDEMDGDGTARRQSVKDNSIARKLTYIKAILKWRVKRRPPLILSNPVSDYQDPSKKDKTFLRQGFVTRAPQDGSDIGTSAENGRTKPETLRKHYYHVTSTMHRNTKDQIMVSEWIEADTFFPKTPFL